MIRLKQVYIPTRHKTISKLKKKTLIILLLILLIVVTFYTYHHTTTSSVLSDTSKTSTASNEEFKPDKTSKIVSKRENFPNKQTDLIDSKPALEKALTTNVNALFKGKVLRDIESNVPIFKRGDLIPLQVMKIDILKETKKLTVKYYLETESALLLKVKNITAYEYLLNIIERELHKQLKNKFTTIEHFSFVVVTEFD